MKILNLNEHDFELKQNFILPGTRRRAVYLSTGQQAFNFPNII